MQINKKGTLGSFRFSVFGLPINLPGQGDTPPPQYPPACDWPVVGKLVRHFTYDGVGRLARTSSPLEAPDGWWFLENETETETTVTAFNRSERFLYDGVRRIQEIVTDPILTDDEEGDVATMEGEEEQRGGSEGGGMGGGGSTPTPERIRVFLRAQYVWGPGDSPTNGVDELLCQIDPYAEETHAPSGPQGKPWFILTDAQGDVTSIVAVPTLGTPPLAFVAGQWTYSPYGEVLTYDWVTGHPAVVFGHKTLAVQVGYGNDFQSPKAKPACGAGRFLVELPD